MSRYYDIDGQQVSQAAWLSDTSDRRVAKDSVGDVNVSTVHLGLDHAWGCGPPLIFETMVFGGEHDQECWRYSNLADAREGHARALALVTGNPA